jgi:hypothetical protein
MKRTFFGALVAFTLLIIPNVMLKAQTFEDKACTALGIKGSSSALETDFNSLVPSKDGVDADNLSSIFEVYDVTQTMQADSLDDFNTGYANLKYAQAVSNMGKLVRESNANIKAVDKDWGTEYQTGDPQTDKILDEYLAYQKAVTTLLEYNTKKYRAGMLKDATAPTAAEIKSAESAVESARNTFKSSLSKVTDVKQQESILTALKKVKSSLKVTAPDAGKDPEVPAKTCNRKEAPDDCKKQAEVFLKNIIDKGQQPAYGTIYVKDKNSCAMDKIMKTLGSVFNLGQVLCNNQVRKNGMVKADGSVNTGSLACLSAYKNLGNTKDNALLNPYIARLDSANAMNLAMLTQGSGSPASLGMGGSTPNNIFSTGTGSTGSETVTDATKSAVSNTGDGVTRYNASQAVSSFYNPSSTTYKNMAANASSFISSTKPISSTISNYNEQLTSAMVNSNPKIASLPKIEGDWATSTLKANISTTQTQQTDALRLEFSQQQAQIQSVTSQLDVTQKKLGFARFMSLYGSQKRIAIAMQEVATYTVSLKMLQSQGKYAQTRLALLMDTLGLGRGYSMHGVNYDILSAKVFNINYMYASNDNRSMPKVLKLKNIKTPLTLKKGWQNDFKKYVEDMSQKSAEAKTAMNEAKNKIKELLAQKLPFISLEKIPQAGEIRDELINMQSIKKASLKNLEIINSAMMYHNSRQKAYTADQYANFKQEEEIVNGAMKRTISSINSAEGVVSEAQDVVDSLHTEIPRSETLRAVAKQMVAQGL